MAAESVEPPSPTPESTQPKATGPKNWAAGTPPVIQTIEHWLEQTGPVRTAKTPDFHNADIVRIVSELEGQERLREGLRLRTYPTALRCAAAYYPETNLSLAAGHLSRSWNTPVASSLVVRFERA